MLINYFLNKFKRKINSFSANQTDPKRVRKNIMHFIIYSIIIKYLWYLHVLLVYYKDERFFGNFDGIRGWDLSVTQTIWIIALSPNLNLI